MTQRPVPQGPSDGRDPDPARPPTIGVLSPSAGGYFFGEILTGVVAGVRDAGPGRVVLVQTIDAGQNSDATHVPGPPIPVAWSQVDALVAVAWAAAPDLLARARASGIPVVLTSCQMPGLDAASVVIDNAGGVRALVAHLVEHGHTAIGFVGYTGQSDIEERWVAYTEAMREHGLEPLPLVPTPDEVESGGAAAAAAVLAAAPRWTAAVAGTDRIAVGLLGALREAGVDVPGDLAVVGFDDVEPGWYSEPPLTTVRQDFRRVGAAAGRLAAREARGQDVPHVRTTVPAPLVPRRSCGCSPDRMPARQDVLHDALALVSDVWALIALDPEDAPTLQPPDPAAPAPRVLPVDDVDVARLDDTVVACFRRILRSAPPPESVELFVQTCVQVLARTAARLPEGSAPRRTLQFAVGRVTALLSREQGALARERVHRLAQTLNTHFDAGMSLLGRTLGDDPADLRWMAAAGAETGCLGLWADAAHTHVRIVGVRDAQGRGLDALVGAVLPVEEFPPAAFLEVADAAADTVAYVIPVRGAGGDHGLLGVVAPLDAEHLTARAVYDHWAALLGAALHERQLLADLQHSEERYALAARAAADGLWEWARGSGAVYLSDRARELLGAREGVDETTVFSAFHPDDREHVRASLRAAAHSPGVPTEIEARLVRPDGTERWVVVRGLAVRRDDAHHEPSPDDDIWGDASGLVGSVSDIDRRRRLEERLRHAALFDPVTGLANRRLFLDRLTQTIEQGRRRPDAGFAVLFLDLDGFKLVNDSLGHLEGDRLLSVIGERLRADLRSTDTAARFGGDEFAVLLAAPVPADLLGVARRLQERIAVPVRLGDQEVTVTASIGIATSHTPYTCAEDVLRDADIAMYRAKESERGTACIFDPAMHEEALDRLRTRTALTQGIARGEVVVHYQPVVDLATRRVTGLEALVRWQHPERGLLAPAAFLPHLEDSRTIVQLGREVLDQVCAQIARWRTAGADAVVSVNLSQREFWSDELETTVVDALARHGVPASALVLEATEAVVMRDPEAAVEVAQGLARHGVRLRLDDFGTGNSSVTALRAMPLDALKVDGSYVHQLAGDEGAATLLAAIVAFGRALGIDVVAEWVETAAQADVLRDLGCRAAQGWYFAPPLPAEEAGALLGTGVEPGTPGPRDNSDLHHDTPTTPGTSNPKKQGPDGR